MLPHCADVLSSHARLRFQSTGHSARVDTGEPICLRGRPTPMIRVGIALLLVSSCLGCTSAAKSSSSPNQCAPTNDPLAVAKAFLVAAEAHDQTALSHCTSRRTPLSSSDISTASIGPWLLDRVQPLQQGVGLQLGPTAIGYNFPSPPFSRGTVVDSGGVSHPLGPDYQGGIFVAVTRESDGRYYVTAVLGYTSG